MKSKSLSILLAIFLGSFGAHWFYLSKRKAWFYLLFCWTAIPAVVAWVDAVIFALESPEIFNEKYNTGRKDKSRNTELANNNGMSNVESKNHIYHLSIPRSALQFLESIDLINTSKNCDIVIGRYAFIKPIYDQIIEASTSPRFVVDITKGVDAYKSAYYDKELGSTEIGFLVKPDRIALANHYGYRLLKCYLNYVQNQNSEIEKLKRESAKIKRYNNVLALAEMVLEEFQHQKEHMTKSEEYYHIIKNLRDKIKESIDQHFSK